MKVGSLKYRGVAQLVAYYVRDVGAGSSSLLTPTNEKAWHEMSEANDRLFHFSHPLEVRPDRI